MNKYGKIAIVAVLAVVVGAVLVVKQNRNQDSPPGESRGPGNPAFEGSGSQDAESTASQQKGNLPRLVDLGAGKCIPCKMMAPILEELKKEYKGQMEVQFIDVWDNRAAGGQYGIRSIPTQIFYDASGKERFRHEGFFSKEDILAKCEELGFNLKEGKSDG